MYNYVPFLGTYVFILNACIFFDVAYIKVDKVEIDGPTSMRVPGYAKKVEFGIMYDFDYPILNSGNFF